MIDITSYLLLKSEEANDSYNLALHSFRVICKTMETDGLEKDRNNHLVSVVLLIIVPFLSKKAYPSIVV